MMALQMSWGPVFLHNREAPGALPLREWGAGLGGWPTTAQATCWDVALPLPVACAGGMGGAVLM